MEQQNSNSNANQPDLAAMMEADAEARDRDFAKADSLLAEVKEALKSDDYERAVDLCSQALILKSNHVDERDKDLADLYYQYGSCLLIKAQRQSDIFGDKAQKKIDEKEEQAQQQAAAAGAQDGDAGAADDDEDEDEDGDEDQDEEEEESGDDNAVEDVQMSEENQSAAAATVSSSSSAAAAAGQNEDVVMESSTNEELTEAKKRELMSHVKISDIVEGKDASESSNLDAASVLSPQDPAWLVNARKKAEKANEPKEESTPANAAEAPGADDLELAWNVLEIARIIYEANGNRKRVADVHMKLGEISMEGDNMQVAADEFQKCLDVRKNIQPFDARAVAEAHFFLALAYEHTALPDEQQPSEQQAAPKIQEIPDFNAEKFKIPTEKAINHLKQARQILEEELKRAESEQRAIDIEELKPIIQDISEKIETLETVADAPVEQSAPATAPGAAFNFGAAGFPGFGDFGAGPASAPPTSFDISQIFPGANKPASTKEFSFNAGPSVSFGPPAPTAIKEFPKFELPATQTFSWNPPSSSSSSSAPAAASPAAPAPGFSFPTVSTSKRNRIAPTVISTDQGADNDATGGLKRKADEVSGGVSTEDQTPAKKANLGQEQQ